jgi:hypothetical protein
MVFQQQTPNVPMDTPPVVEKESGSRDDLPQPPPSLPASVPDGDDVQVSTPSAAAQNETVICVNPTDRDHLIGGANDQRNGPINTAFYSSFDGGLNWNELIYPKQEYTYAGDPATAFGPDGEVYFGALELPDFSYSTCSLYVGRSFDGGLTVPSWTRVVGQPGVFEDRQLLQADLSDGPLRGTLYLTWTRFTNNLTVFPIYMSSSFDQGQTWSVPRGVSDTMNCQVAHPAVGPDSELYVTFIKFGPPERIMIDRSLDSGLTWGTDVVVGPTNCTLPNAPFTHFCAPYCDVDRSDGPYRGSVYVVYTYYVNNEGGTDIHLYRSTDGAQSFQGPIAVSDEANGSSEFFPFVDVDPNGNVNVGYYDRRGSGGGDTLIAYRVSRSSDGGQTFQKSVRVSDVKFDPYTYTQGTWIGDYTGIAASDRTVHPLWTDGRNGDNDIMTSRVQLDLHSDVETISVASGGSVAFTLNPGPLYAGSSYRLLGSVSGTTPGLTFANGVNLPLNWDPFLLITLSQANSPALQNFAGTLDAEGSAFPVLDTHGPVDPILVGLHMNFAALVGSGPVWTSNPTGVTFDP